MDVFNDMDKSSFPAGSTVDMSRPPSPVDLCDFPYLDLDPPTYATTEIEPPYIAVDISQGDQVVHLKCSIRTIGLSGTDDVFPSCFI